QRSQGIQPLVLDPLALDRPPESAVVDEVAPPQLERERDPRARFRNRDQAREAVPADPLLGRPCRRPPRINLSLGPAPREQRSSAKPSVPASSSASSTSSMAQIRCVTDAVLRQKRLGAIRRKSAVSPAIPATEPSVVRMSGAGSERKPVRLRSSQLMRPRMFG